MFPLEKYTEYHRNPALTDMDVLRHPQKSQKFLANKVIFFQIQLHQIQIQSVLLV